MHACIHYVRMQMHILVFYFIFKPNHGAACNFNATRHTYILSGGEICYHLSNKVKRKLTFYA